MTGGCSSGNHEKLALNKEEFHKKFTEDCIAIEIIYEGHDSSGYYFTGYTGGNYTNHPISLTEMSAWLKSCGVKPENVTQILE